jgi:hypothetical protein
MSQLTKGMYGTEFCQKGDIFGLHCGQMRSRDKITHNSGWYNRAGEKLGWGDLDAKDFERIARELEYGEYFIVLSEQDSYWKVDKEMVEAPGTDYVVEHAMYIIVAADLLFKVDKCGSERGAFFDFYGLTFHVLKKGKVERLVKEGRFSL